MLHKRVTSPLRRTCDSRPLFVLGKQRSGTTMLMRCFHRHPDMLVYDEHMNNAAFQNVRLREFATIRQLLERAHFPVVCFKPIADSHRILELDQQFAGSHFIWLYRNYWDVANSALKKFSNTTYAVRLVCTGQTGGGWFQEGVSESVADTLRDVYHPDLTDFDLACLTWWARNRIILDSGLIGRPNVTVLRYETLVCDPCGVLEALFKRIGIPYHERIVRNVTSSRIRHQAPVEPDHKVRELCEEELAALNEASGPGQG